MQLREQRSDKADSSMFPNSASSVSPGVVLGWAWLPVAKESEKKDNMTMSLSESVFLGWEKGNLRYRKSMLCHAGNH